MNNNITYTSLQVYNSTTHHIIIKSYYESYHISTCNIQQLLQDDPASEEVVTAARRGGGECVRLGDKQAASSCHAVYLYVTVYFI